MADPVRRGMKRFVNKLVKGRECLRPFAPSVLEGYADKWFDMSRWGGGGGGGEAGGEAVGGCKGQGGRDGQEPIHEPNRLREGWEGESNPCSSSCGRTVLSSDGIQDRQTILSFPNIGLSCPYRRTHDTQHFVQCPIGRAHSVTPLRRDTIVIVFHGIHRDADNGPLGHKQEVCGSRIVTG